MNLMKRIGVLTFHRSNNTGAFLQCYSLCVKLQNDFPDHKIEVIDYETQTTYQNYSGLLKDYLNIGIKEKDSLLRKLVIYIKRLVSIFLVHRHRLADMKTNNEIFDNAVKCNLPLTEWRLISNDCDDFYKSIAGKYDLIIVGSDCVWKYIGYPFPNAYLLHDVHDCIKVSYAACAYRMNVDSMSKEMIHYFKESIESLDYVGIRDSQTESVLNKVGIINNMVYNCDPTFLLDISNFYYLKEGLIKKIKAKGIDLERPIIGIQLRNNRLSRQIKKQFGGEYQIVAIRERNDYADCFLNDLTPFEWAIVFSFFKLTITDFFHASIFSILNYICPVVIDNKCGFYEGEISRVEDIMTRLGLKQCYYSYSDVDENIDIYSLVEYSQQVSKDYLINRINEQQKTYSSFYEYVKRMVNE